MDKRIESYLDSVIPEKLSKRRQKLIREELRDHISDHIDFYTEIGYSEDESIQKALADMGDDGGVTAMVKKDFEKVYGEKIWMPILAFVLTVGIGSLLYLFASFLFGTSFSDACSALVGFAAMLGVSLVMESESGTPDGSVHPSCRLRQHPSAVLPRAQRCNVPAAVHTDASHFPARAVCTAVRKIPSCRR